MYSYLVIPNRDVSESLVMTHPYLLFVLKRRFIQTAMTQSIITRTDKLVIKNNLWPNIPRVQFI